MLDLQPIKTRLAAATLGPWRYVRDDPNEYVISIATVNDEIFITMPNDVVCSTPEADADLIANAPTDIKALVAEVERLRGAITEHQRTVKPGDDYCGADVILWRAIDA